MFQILFTVPSHISTYRMVVRWRQKAESDQRYLATLQEQSLLPSSKRSPYQAVTPEGIPVQVR